MLDLGIRLGLLNFEIASFTSTPINNLEFYVTLRRVSPGDVARQCQSIALARKILESAPTPGPHEAAEDLQTPTDVAESEERETESAFETSGRERSLLLLKRRVVYTARTAGKVVLSRVRSWLGAP